MTVSLGQLDSRVFLGLAAAGEYTTLSDIHDVVVQRLNARTMQSRTSDINVLLGTTAEFTPDSVPYDITSLIGKSVPCWVETKQNLVDGIDWWSSVRIVNQNQFNDYKNMGAFACSFYGDETSSTTAQPVQYISFTYLPVRPCRIRFDRDDQRTDIDSDIILPDNLSELIVLEAQNSLIPRIKNMLALGLRRDAEGRQDAALILNTLDGIYAQNMIDIKPLDAQWRVWCFRARDSQTSFNLPVPASEALYVGGRNLGWGSWGGGTY